MHFITWKGPSTSIPEIRKKAVELFYRSYNNQEVAINAFAGLEDYYRVYYTDFYSGNSSLVVEAILALQNAYAENISVEQKADWNSHPNDVGHQYSPGCFRCHDGKHLNADQQSIRLECNLCHSIPVVADEVDFVTNIEISRGLEPESHLSTNWIGMHRDVFDYTCENCHSVEDPGGTSNTSFCSNSACHGSVYKYAGFDAPSLREILLAQLPPPPPPPPPLPVSDTLTYDQSIGTLLTFQCGSCHNEAGLADLNLLSYNAAMSGGKSGPVIIPGDPENSLLVTKQTGSQPHFGKFTPQELDFIVEWISMGAPEHQ